MLGPLGKLKRMEATIADSATILMRVKMGDPSWPRSHIWIGPKPNKEQSMWMLGLGQEGALEYWAAPTIEAAINAAWESWLGKTRDAIHKLKQKSIHVQRDHCHRQKARRKA